jgi:hypothetical protein
MRARDRSVPTETLRSPPSLERKVAGTLGAASRAGAHASGPTPKPAAALRPLLAPARTREPGNDDEDPSPGAAAGERQSEPVPF